MAAWSRLIPDRMSGLLLLTLLLALFLPVSAEMASPLGHVSNAMVALLFFMHGAKLDSKVVLAGLLHWRLHALILALTYLLFPALVLVLGQAARYLPQTWGSWLLQLYPGFIYLAILPSTVQSSVSFTALARGNVAAAVCAATASNLLGIVLTPLYFALLFHANNGLAQGWQTVAKICLQLLLPFVLGQILRPLLKNRMNAHADFLKWLDQLAILLVVYLAMSEAVQAGIWQQLPLAQVVLVLFLCAVLLAAILLIAQKLARRVGFSLPDQIALVFCGSKKSLASGVPMAKILFAGQASGMGLALLILPLLIFHQIQLMVCAHLAHHYARRTGE